MSWNVVGVIPARGGSKAIPDKNIRPLAGRPLIAYTIEAAKKAMCLSRVIVSTDSEKIAAVARNCGAEVIMRPAEYATDTAPTELTLIHVVEMLAREGVHPDAVVTLEPTSPLRSHQLIDRCVRALMEGDVDSVITVVETRACYGTIAGGRFDYLVKGQPRRRQDREPLYRESSTVYATRTETLLARVSVLGERLGAVIVDEEEAIDINTPVDFVVAEAVMRWRERKSVS